MPNPILTSIASSLATATSMRVVALARRLNSMILSSRAPTVLRKVVTY